MQWPLSGDPMPRESPRDRKFRIVMEEFKRGSLTSSSGSRVTSPAQAKAIAASEAGLKKKRKRHGPSR